MPFVTPQIPPSIPFPNLNPPGVTDPYGNNPFVPVPLPGNARPAQAVFFQPGCTLSCDNFPVIANSDRITLSMFVWIPSSGFPKGKRQTLFCFGPTQGQVDPKAYVLKFLDNPNPVPIPPNFVLDTIGPMPTDIPRVSLNPNIVPPDGASEWVYYNGGFWHYETVPSTIPFQSQIVVESGGIFSAVYAAFKDSKGADIEFPQLVGWDGVTDGRKEILFKTDQWNWIAVAINTGDRDVVASTGGRFIGLNGPMSFPSLPQDAGNNAPIAYSQVQFWTTLSLAFTNPTIAGNFMYQAGDVYKAQPDVPISSMSAPPPNKTLPSGTYAPPAQDWQKGFGTSAVLFDGDSNIFPLNRGSLGGTWSVIGGPLLDFPISPS